ncbi:methyltransferase domain-containing protein [Diaporthe sp. PMI_573]|nr:methyltransferase domain-containing protein [Diaporthaceae sp. PMI_573]
MDSTGKRVPADLKTKVTETYDAIAAKYNEWSGRNETTREYFLGQLLKALPDAQGRQLSVLELGCGAALTSTRVLLPRPGIHVIANDMSAAQLELAKKNLSEFSEADVDRVTFRQGDMMHLSFPDESLDAVVGLYSVIHLPREEQSELLARTSRWLRPGGHMLVNFTPDDYEAKINPSWLAEKGWMFWSGWGSERTAELLKGNGFDIISAELRGDIGDSSFYWVIARKK